MIPPLFLLVMGPETKIIYNTGNYTETLLAYNVYCYCYSCWLPVIFHAETWSLWPESSLSTFKMRSKRRDFGAILKDQTHVWACHHQLQAYNHANCCWSSVVERWTIGKVVTSTWPENPWWYLDARPHENNREATLGCNRAWVHRKGRLHEDWVAIEINFLSQDAPKRAISRIFWHLRVKEELAKSGGKYWR